VLKNKQNQGQKTLDGMRNGEKYILCSLLLVENVLWCYFEPSILSTRWEKYDAKGWTEKGAHKYGRLNEQSWWERWGEHYDGRGFVLNWCVSLTF
jgi:hypothetical protein